MASPELSSAVFADFFVPLSSKMEALKLPLQNAFLFDFLLVVGESLLSTSFRCAVRECCSRRFPTTGSTGAFAYGFIKSSGAV